MNHEVINKIYKDFRDENVSPVPKKSIINFLRSVFHLEARLKTNELKPSELSPPLRDTLDKFIKELWVVFEMLAKPASDKPNLQASIQLLRQTIESIESDVNRKENIDEAEILTLKSQEKISDTYRPELETVYHKSEISNEDRERNEKSLKENYEEELLDLASQLKNIANSYADQLKTDNILIEDLNKVQDKNLDNVESKSKDLDAFLKKSKSLSIWRLLFMGVVAILLFSFTVVVIVVDHKIFGFIGL